MTLMLNYFRIYFFSYDQRRWEPNNLSLKVQISLYLCTYDSCISLPPSFLSFLVFPGRVKGFLLSVQIILCIFHNTWIIFFLLLFQGDSDSLKIFFIFLVPSTVPGITTIKHLSILLYNERVTKENTLILMLPC